MKSVVITGSARGLGYEMAKEFYKNDFNVLMCDINEEKLVESLNTIKKDIKSKSDIICVKCDVTNEKDLKNVIDKCVDNFKNIDIWINNAGVNQPNNLIWEVDNSTVNKILDIDLRATMMGTALVLKQMIKQGFGQVYCVEGYGSNDAMMPGLSIYGTSKRALTYYYMALAKEIDSANLPIKVGRLSPGIMITDFITNSVSSKIELSQKTKNVYNILGDYPDVIAKFLVSKMINNQKNNVHFCWLTSKKAFFRFMTCAFNKRDFFNEK